MKFIGEKHFTPDTFTQKKLLFITLQQKYNGPGRFINFFGSGCTSKNKRKIYFQFLLKKKISGI